MRALLAAAGAVALLTAAAPAEAQVTTFPLPGTQTASARTQISFRGVEPDKIGAVRVTGSRSGRHGGRLRAHSDGNGASFVVSSAFRQGERVTVRSRVRSYSFAIGRRPAPLKTRPGELPGVGRGEVQRFETRPDLAPPALLITRREEGRAPGLIFLGAKSGRGQDGPMIVDDFGNLVWFNAIGNRELATDFRVQSYLGKPVLTWWQGRLIGGEGRGEGVIYDTAYRPVRRVRAGNGLGADLHEFELTPQGTALLLIYDAVKRDLRGVGGARKGVVVQAVVQEVDIATGLVVFEWHSLGNVGLSESHETVPKHGGQWDYVHANSVAVDAGGELIVSARQTSAVYRISRQSGRILWRLGGSRSDFKLGPGTRFGLQHDARPQPDGTLTIFDNSAPPPQRKASRAITVRLDTRAQDGDAGPGAQAPREPAVGHPGRRAAAPQRRHVRRLGLAPLLHRVRRRRAGGARRPLRDRRRQLPRLQVPVAGAPGSAARARRDPARRSDRRARELERRDRRRHLGTVGRSARGRADPRQGSAPRGVRNRDLGGRRRTLRSGRALDIGGVLLGSSATIRTDSSAR